MSELFETIERVASESAQPDDSGLQLLKLDARGSSYHSGLWGLWSDRGVLIQIERAPGPVEDPAIKWQITSASVILHHPITDQPLRPSVLNSAVAEWATRHRFFEIRTRSRTELLALIQTAWTKDAPPLRDRARGLGGGHPEGAG